MDAGRYFILKGLTGPHLGAEVRLPAGEYRIGSGADCDIVLSDVTVAAEHVLIVISPDGIRLQNLGGEVRVGGALHSDPSALVPFYSVIGVGTSLLAVGPEGAAWPDIALPTIVADRPNETEPEPPPAAVPSQPAQAETAVRHLPGRSRLVAASLILAIMILIPLGRREFEAPPAAASSKNEDRSAVIAQELEKRIASVDPKIALKVVREKGDDRWLIEGYVPSGTERRAILEKLRDVDADVQTKIYASDDIVKAVNDTLAGLGRKLDVTSDRPGDVTLTGFISESSDVQRVIDIVRHDVAGIRDLKNDIASRDSILAALQADVAQAGLEKQIKLRLDKLSIVASGNLMSEEMEGWRKIREEFDSRDGKWLTLVSHVQQVRTDQPPAPPGLQLDVRAVGLGDMPFVVLGDGQKYLSGSTIRDGWTIVDIRQDQIILSHDGELYVHEL